MRLRKLTLENFRCYREPIDIEFDDLTALVGRNDVGKSAIMDALAIFFGEAVLDKDDACKAGDRTKVRLTCEFDELPTALVVDTDFPTTLADEHLLGANGRLQIRKTYNGKLEKPKLISVEALAEHPTAPGIGDLLTLKRADLIARAGDFRVDLEGVNQRANAPIRAAIRAAVGDLQLRAVAVPLEIEDGDKQIWTALVPYLPTFALFKSDRASTDQDSEAQDPLKAAIKEALKGVEAELERVKVIVETEVKKIADATVEKLREMDPSLAETLHPVISAKKWETLFSTSITGEEGIPLNKRGSGVKRLVLLNFFRAKAERDAIQQNKASIIYAVEEPETSQHPRNQRMLLSALRELSGGAGRQVIITTHTPMLARCLDDEALRFLQKDDEGVRTFLHGGGEANQAIADSLGVLPDHGVQAFIGVEGPHDIRFLKAVSRILVAAGENVPDLEALELDGRIIFFPFGGSNLALWADRLKGLNRPEFHLCDRDVPPPGNPKYHDHMEAVNARAGCRAIATNRRETENYLHWQAVCEAYERNGTVINLAGAFGEFDDVPALVAEAVHGANAEKPWAELTPQEQKAKADRAKHMLNGMAAEGMSAAQIAECDPDGEIRGWLIEIRHMIEQVEGWAG